MKIAAIETIKIQSRMNAPLHMSYGTVDILEPVLVRIETDTGIVGWGEANTISFVTGETPETILDVLDFIKGHLIGEDPLCIARIHQIMDSLIANNPAAKCGIDIALYDIYGQALGVPLYKILGGDSDSYWVDIALSMEDPDVMAAEALKRKNEGFRIFKVKAGRDVETDIEAVKRIREACGNEVELRVDANQGWSRAESVRAIEGYRKYGVIGLEQPVPEWDIEGMAFIREKAGGMEIIADEAVKSPQAAAHLIRNNAADMFSIKLEKAGGLYPAREIVSVAKAFNIECMLGCMCETGVALSAGAHFVAGEKHITVGDTDAFALLDEPRVEAGFRFDNGRITVSDRPGTGVQVKL